ncbi:hypothetical protein BU56_05570 [Escherichia coli O145:H25 str. 07-3858]|nr:hypothetical protein BU56_05570 [Escherichia coli O145:H25 str. 07-3858]
MGESDLRHKKRRSARHMSPFDLPGRQSRHPFYEVPYNHKPCCRITASSFLWTPKTRYWKHQMHSTSRSFR